MAGTSIAGTSPAEQTAGVGPHGARVAVIFLVVAWLALSALTAAGSLRRGQGRCLAVVTGLFFPLAWVMWYLTDQRHAGRRAHVCGVSRHLGPASPIPRDASSTELSVKHFQG